MQSNKNNVCTKVTFYDDLASGRAVYAGSTFVFFIMLTGNILSASAAMGGGAWGDNGYSKSGPLFIEAAVANVLAFLAQTVDAIYYDHTYWPLQAAKWSCELFAITLLSSILGFSLSVQDSIHLARVSTTALLLFVHVVFTSSSLSVSLEYLYRKSATDTGSTQRRRVT